MENAQKINIHNIDDKINAICKIMYCCEESELISFEYRDEKIAIQFNKLSSNNNDFYEYMENTKKDNNKEKKVHMQCVHNVMSEAINAEESLQFKNSEENEDCVVITSPFVGIIEFSNHIRENLGELKINKGDVICSIEAMKLYNDIKSSVTGTVIQILVEDHSFLAYEQPIMKVRIDEVENEI